MSVAAYQVRSRWVGFLTGLSLLLLAGSAWAAGPHFEISLGEGGAAETVTAFKILGLLTVLTLAPAILITMTAFTRIVIVFSFVRHALGTQQMPPNQVVIGLSLFLTMFVMRPVWERIHTDALVPYQAGEVNEQIALKQALVPLHEFMLRQTREKDLGLFYGLTGTARPSNVKDVATGLLIPAFVVSELKTAFQMGFLLFVPFLVLDLVIASLLMAMGMMMLPPVLISLPFKVMLFVLVDGWNLLVGGLLRSFA